MSKQDNAFQFDALRLSLFSGSVRDQNCSFTTFVSVLLVEGIAFYTFSLSFPLYLYTEV
jgi:hypothetical protein